MQNPETMVVFNKNGEVIINVDEFDPELYQKKPIKPVSGGKTGKAEDTQTIEPVAFDRAAVETYLTLIGVTFEAGATDEELVALKSEAEAKIAAAGTSEA